MTVFPFHSTRAIPLVYRFLFAAILVSPALSDDVRAQSPRIMAHYMPWYQAKPYAASWGWHWTMDHFNPDAIDADGKRSIASHYYPTIGPYDSRDPDVLEYHALLMKVSGIDGVIVDWYGTSNLHDYPMLHEATHRAFEIMRSTGLSFAVCYEDQTVQRLVDAGQLSPADAVAHAQEQMRYAEIEWMGDPAYLRLDGRPVVLNFGPQYFETSSEWEEIFGAMEVNPLFFTLDEPLQPVAAGGFSWPPMWRATNGELSSAELDRYLDVFYAYGTAEWSSFIGGAVPGFHDIYAEAGVGPSYGFLDSRDGQTFRETLQRAVDEGSAVIQIATWNDFGEGTNVEPAEEYGFRYLAEVQETVRGLRELPYSADDLALPLQLFRLRKDPETSTQGDSALDLAASSIIAGNPAEARAILSELSTATGDVLPNASGGATLELYPNPASGSATLVLDLPSPATAEVAVFDALGRQVLSVGRSHHASGRHRLNLGAHELRNGVYFVRATIGTTLISRALVVRH